MNFLIKHQLIDHKNQNHENKLVPYFLEKIDVLIYLITREKASKKINIYNLNINLLIFNSKYYI